MKTVTINGAAISDEDSLHDEFSTKLGFAGYCGRNRNAWIDCMSYLTEPSADIIAAQVEAGEELCLRILDGVGLEKRCPDLVKTLLECTEFVNDRYLSTGECTRISVVLDPAGEQADEPVGPAAGTS
jgi:RNAse (barnase) inhibitor barstar